MEGLSSILILLAIGLIAGMFSGMFGIGGGLIIIPALVYLMGFSQHLATGTSLAILLPPVGLAATLEFYRHGNVDVKAALIVALGLFAGGWVGAAVSSRMSGPHLRLSFGVFVVGVGCYLVIGALRRLGWA